MQSGLLTSLISDTHPTQSCFVFAVSCAVEWTSCKNAMCTSLLFFFPCSSKQILHQVCKTCSSLTFLGPVLKVKALKSTGNLFPYFFKNPHGQKSFDRQLSPAMTMLQKLMGSDAYTDPAPAETNTPTCVLAISKSFWQNHID